jgi:hypothetical protein
MEKVAVYAGHKVLMDIDDNSVLIVNNPQGILSQQLRPHPIYLSNEINIIIITY